MLNGAFDRKIKFRLSALIDQQPVSPTIEKNQRAFVSDIQALLLILDTVPTGTALLQEAVERNVSVGLDPLLEANGNFFYPAQNHFDFGYQPEILADTQKGQGRYLTALIGGLRRAWHHARGNAADVSLKPEDFLRQFRCSAADIESVIHLVGWELRAMGQSALWRSLLSGANGDIAVVFERSVEADPHALFDGRALRMAFNQWFAERARVDACDRSGLEIIDAAMLQIEHAGKIGTQQGREDHVRRLGTLPSGTNYLAGCHFGSNWYDGMQDSSNRTHLKGIEQDIIKMSAQKNAPHFRSLS